MYVAIKIAHIAKEIIWTITDNTLHNDCAIQSTCKHVGCPMIEWLRWTPNFVCGLAEYPVAMLVHFLPTHKRETCHPSTLAMESHKCRKGVLITCAINMVHVDHSVPVRRHSVQKGWVFRKAFVRCSKGRRLFNLANSCFATLKKRTEGLHVHSPQRSLHNVVQCEHKEDDEQDCQPAATTVADDPIGTPSTCVDGRVPSCSPLHDLTSTLDSCTYKPYVCIPCCVDCQCASTLHDNVLEDCFCIPCHVNDSVVVASGSSSFFCMVQTHSRCNDWGGWSNWSAGINREQGRWLEVSHCGVKGEEGVRKG